MLLLAFCLPLTLIAQQVNTFTNDADKLYQLLSRTPSFKAQFKGAAKDSFKRFYEALRLQVTNGNFDAFYRLSALITATKDNHLGFYLQPDTSISYALSGDRLDLRKFHESAAYKSYPVYQGNLDSLGGVLAAKSDGQIEGVFNFGSYITAGITRTAKNDSLVAVVLRSRSPLWVAGDVIFILKEYTPGRYNVYHGSFNDHTYQLQRDVTYTNGSINVYGWNKQALADDHSQLPAGTPYYQFKALNDSTQYLRLGKFSATSANMADAARFHDSIKTLFNTNNLIVDLRNNGGGSFKTSKRFVKLITRHAKKHQVYVLINKYTVSNAEQFALDLKGRKNITLLGENTKGMLAYGSNYGKTETLPSGKFVVYLTDIRNSNRYKQYEDKGIAPDVVLTTDSDWIGQVQKMINKKGPGIKPEPAK